ncbi:hypothetical protein [Pararhodospirillum photometricum]|uniref:hypothetical protein n=1 Tax=Pararhodospirillum photometricum TaxID=1084 RepID=UPI0003114924|nr:hypothetical protein [Pararhodospirillum photometricum]
MSDATTDPVLREALEHLSRAGTWEELRADLDRQGILQALGSEGRQALGLAWEHREVTSLDDGALAADLCHWAQGGDRRNHPRGFQAPRPAVLVAEAARRGWFTRRLPGGRCVVNPPGSPPLVVGVAL